MNVYGICTIDTEDDGLADWVMSKPKQNDMIKNMGHILMANDGRWRMECECQSESKNTDLQNE
jgi:hypothetical protein